MRSLKGILLGFVVCLISTGCALTHEAQPHRLWRFNRGPGPSSNPYFSVSDPISEPSRRASVWTPSRLSSGGTVAPVDSTHELPVTEQD